MSLKMRLNISYLLACTLMACVWWGGGSPVLAADDSKPSTSGVSQDKENAKPKFPPLSKIIKDYKEVEPKDGGDKPFYKLWKNDETGVILARLPKNYASAKARQFIATTVSGGETRAGLQADDFYVYWRKYGKRLALMSENLRVKGSDAESKSSVSRLFTDRVLLDVPILTMDAGRPVINLNSVLVSNSRTFFAGSGRSLKSGLLKIKKADAFEKNIEIAYEAPTSGGILKTLHYSISEIKGSPGFKPRKADQRIGYFLTSYADYGKYESDDMEVRYINRWHLEKRKSNLKLSPPKKAIVFYIEHTTPVRYRRWVRKGILSWNKAFEKIGFSDAIQVRQQDKETGEHMELSPEDVRYNFVRWLNNNQSTAIGPSRVNPKTGEILDADIILTDGWIRTFENQFSNLMPKILMEGKSERSLLWYAKHPNWDPRLRLAEPGQRHFLQQQLAYQASQPYAGHKSRTQNTRALGDEITDGLVNRTSQVNGACMAAEGRGFDVALMRMSMAVMKARMDENKKNGKDKAEKDDDEKDDDEKDDDDDEQMIDGMPESFIGPLLADLVAHEVGHTLGLRHNFKASSVYSISEINSADMKGKRPLSGSVMDYLPTNFKMNHGEVQGDYAMIGVGPYDMWAIEYGYTLDSKKLPKILKRVSEPELAFATDEDTFGPDPLARRYDFGKNPLDFAKDQVSMALLHRKTILDKFVKDGEPWGKARRGYLMTLGLQTRATSMMANWLGGTFVNRDLKGDPRDRKPIEVVPAEDQRAALEFVIKNVFFDETYGLTPELLAYMTNEPLRRFSSPSWPVHDRVIGIQASTLSNLLDPSTLTLIYDNEFRIDADQDAFTLNELFSDVNEAIWKEVDEAPEGKFTERKPAISSLRRNLQTEHIERLFDLASETESSTAAMKPIANLSSMTLRDLLAKLEKAKENKDYDAYSSAHLQDSYHRVKKWVDSTYVINNDAGSNSGFGGFLLFKEAMEANQSAPDNR